MTHKLRVGRRVGLTLIELLVIISIIGLLIAILIPAVQHVREAARRASCVNNLHQIGLSLQNYNSTFGCFPAGNSGRGLSLHVAVLPYMEQLSLYSSINFSIRGPLFASSVNKTVASTNVKSFFCPSDFRGNSFLNNSYAGNEGYNESVDYLRYEKNRWLPNGLDNGVFLSKGGPLTAAAITDGLSTTASMSEWVKDQSIFSVDLPIHGKGMSGIDEFSQKCSSIGTADINYRLPFYGWICGNFGNTLYNHIMRINQHTCTFYGSITVGAWTASSRHESGANLMFSDSHVSFVRGSMNAIVWRGIGTRNGGEIGSD